MLSFLPISGTVTWNADRRHEVLSMFTSKIGFDFLNDSCNDILYIIRCQKVCRYRPGFPGRSNFDMACLSHVLK